ncbi:hypothetical protein EG850_04420 [Gulosibacter macacae]|uniref:Uncharacterized protein n=1 Tax=Gulosibacter macacae TaxID=2488791 RepID=A0A3P3VXN3_9MICO|nr:hypothetical protein [Gulosibacter macacae]RRJ87551.1 hypothetical protein EG850_04420 [Gulosibacter macacae]
MTVLDARRKGQRIPGIVVTVILGVLVASYLGLGWYLTSIPGGGDIFLTLLAGLAFLATVVPLVTLLIMAIRERRMRWALVIAPVLLATGFALFSARVPMQLSWPSIRADLEAAEAAGVCPERVGFVEVKQCVLVEGYQGYDFGNGFLNQDVLMHLGEREAAEAAFPLASENPGTEGWVLREEISDGWWRVTFVW